MESSNIPYICDLLVYDLLNSYNFLNFTCILFVDMYVFCVCYDWIRQEMVIQRVKLAVL